MTEANPFMLSGIPVRVSKAIPPGEIWFVREKHPCFSGGPYVLVHRIVDLQVAMDKALKEPR